MISPIRNWVSNLSSYASSYSKTPSTSKSGPDTPIHLVRDRALSMLETDRSKILSEVSATTVENLNKQLNNVSKKIYTLSRSWFSFLYKGHIQELLEKRHRIIDSLSEAKDIVEQELLENFKDNFRNTTSNTPTACAQSLEKIIENDPTKAFEIFLSEAQSDPKRAASILLANPISLKKIFNHSCFFAYVVFFLYES